MRYWKVILYVSWVIGFGVLTVYLFTKLDDAYSTPVSNRFWAFTFAICFVLIILLEKKSKAVWFISPLLFPVMQLTMLVNADLHQWLVQVF